MMLKDDVDNEVGDNDFDEAAGYVEVDPVVVDPCCC